MVGLLWKVIRINKVLRVWFPITRLVDLNEDRDGDEEMEEEEEEIK